MSMSVRLGFRLEPESKSKFEEMCRSAGREPSDVAREIIEAFNEDRLRIIKSNDDESKLQNLYMTT